MTVRGIRDSIPGGYVIGRLGTTKGAAELISIKDLANAVASFGSPIDISSVVGVSGGVLGFTAATVLASSAQLGANKLVVGGGAGALPTTPVGLGTITTLLHGNAAGAPSFGAVANADLTNSSLTLNGVTVALGASGTLTLASANFANQGTTTTVLHGNAAGNPSWGAVSLTADVSGTLPAASGGTGQATYAIGDLLYASGATAISRLADVAAGSYMRSGGVTTAPLWSTLTLPNSANSGDILKASGANAYASSAPAALTKTDDTNVTLTLGGSATTSLVNAASLTLGWTGQLGLTRGGSNNTLTASNGGVVWSDASKLNILSGTSTANQALLSGASATPAWSTATYPATATISQVMYASGTNAWGSSANFTFNGTDATLAGGLTVAGVTSSSFVSLSYANPDVAAMRVNATTGTNAAGAKFTNTGGNVYVGEDSSTGGRVTGTAYAGYLWHEGNNPIIIGTNNTVTATFDTSQNTTLAGSVKTANPASGAGAWKLGQRQAAVGLILLGTNYVEVNIDGTTVKLAEAV